MITIVGLLWTGLTVGYFALPQDAIFMLFRFPLSVRPVFALLAIFLGVALFWMFGSRLPISKKSKDGCLSQALLWMLVMPGMFMLFFVLVALDVSYPIIDPLMIPIFLAGVLGLVVWYAKMTGLNGRLLVRALEWVSRHVR